MKTLICACATTFALTTSVAQAADAPTNPLYEALGSPTNWRISGSFRSRIEGIDGQFRPTGAPSDGFLSFRSTLFAEYDPGAFRIGAEIQDSRGYFEKTASSVSATEINTLEPIQAYVGYKFKEIDGSNASIIAGRFTQDIGSRRLVARNVFRNTTNSFTGVAFDFKDRSGDKLRLFWTLPDTRLPNDSVGIQKNDIVYDRENTALQFYGGSFTKAHVFGGSLELYGYGLTERDAPNFPTTNRRLFTPGGRLFRAPKVRTFDYDLEGAYQTGETRATSKATDLTDLKVSAFFVHAEVGRTFKTLWSPRVALEYDYDSGNGTDPHKSGRFDTLFSARRFEYGPTSLYGAVGRANLNSPSLRFEVTPDRRWDAFVAYRPLWLASATDSFSNTGIRDPKGLSGTFAGNQIEWRARYWLIPKIARLDGGFAYLAKGHFLEAAPNAQHDGDTKYGYLDLTFTF